MTIRIKKPSLFFVWQTHH